MRRWIWIFLPLLGACSMAGIDVSVPTALSPFTDRLSQMIAFAKGRESLVDGGRIATSSVGAGPGQPLEQNWRVAEANLYLDQAGPQDPAAEFLFPGQRALATRIIINSLASGDMKASIGCDSVSRLYGAGGRTGNIRAGQTRDFVLSGKSHGQVHLNVGPEVTQCDLRWGEGKHLRLRREDLARPDLAQLDGAEVRCTAPDPARLDALETAFYSDRWLSQSCAQGTGNVALLEDPLEALNARFEALTGRKISRARLLEGNPDMALDFSAAPKLDLIYVSYLLMRADYSGYLLRRLLAHHAERGTVVRILVTGNLMLDFDRAMYEELAARHPNVQIQYFEWSKSGLNTPAELINQIQRSHHMKVFATLSSEPGWSRFIVGGRNIWDGFFFDQPFDLTEYPGLRTYDVNATQARMYYSIYTDFEVEMRGENIVKDFMAHLSTFWHRDTRNQVARVMSVTDRFAGPARSGQTRHFLSLPWADGLAQQEFFVDLFDAAEEEIVIVTPFMYPPSEIVNAMLRARARGVRVIVVARITSTDPSGEFVTALNRGFVQEWAGDFEVYQYVPGRRMIHTKLILIDGRLSVVTSTNMNRRSFLHDSENGLVFLDTAVTKRLRKVVNTYLARTTRMQPGEELLPFEKAMNGLTGIWQYF